MSMNSLLEAIRDLLSGPRGEDRLCMYLFFGERNSRAKIYSFYFTIRGFVVPRMIYPLHNCKPKGICSSGVEFGFSFKDDTPPACFLCVQRKQRVHSVPPIPKHLLLLCFSCRIFPSSIVVQTVRYVGVSGSGKIGLRVLNTKSSPQIYTNMTSTREEILVNTVYPLRLCSISD